MVGEEGDLEDLIRELREYTFQKEEMIRPPRWLITRFLLSSLGLVLGNVSFPLYYAGYVATLVLGYFLLLAPPENPLWAELVAVLAAYSSGFSLNRVTALDFWPWLGPRWRLPRPTFPWRRRTPPPSVRTLPSSGSPRAAWPRILLAGGAAPPIAAARNWIRPCGRGSAPPAGNARCTSSSCSFCSFPLRGSC